MAVFDHFFQCLKDDGFSERFSTDSKYYKRMMQKIRKIIKFYTINPRAFEIEFNAFSNKVTGYFDDVEHEDDHPKLYLVLHLLSKMLDLSTLSDKYNPNQYFPIQKEDKQKIE